MKKRILIATSSLLIIIVIISCTFKNDKKETTSNGENYNKTEKILLAELPASEDVGLANRSFDIRANDTIVIIENIDYKPKKIILFMTFYDDRSQIIGQSVCTWLDGDDSKTKMTNLDYFNSTTKNWRKNLIHDSNKVGLLLQDKNNMQFWDVEPFVGGIKVFKGETKGNPTQASSIKYNAYIK